MTSLPTFLVILKREQRAVMAFIAIAVSLAVIASIFLPRAYKASARLLIIQHTVNADAFTVSRSVDQIAKLFTNVVRTTSFLDQVRETNPALELDVTRKEWRRMIRAENIFDTGIIEVDTFTGSKEQSTKLLETVLEVLTKKNQLYHGFGNAIDLTLVDAPIVNRFPVRPNIVANTALAFFFALLVSVLYLLREAGVQGPERISIPVIPTSPRQGPISVRVAVQNNIPGNQKVILPQKAPSYVGTGSGWER
ncbi:MAG: hypothetical protein HY459_01200 [Parcubacteria group bacterium]|nr:hypothetical protein [Parcubacteria group bacterium]